MGPIPWGRPGLHRKNTQAVILRIPDALPAWLYD